MKKPVRKPPQDETPSATVPFQTTLAVRDACLCLHVQRAARALARRFDLALKPLGLTNGQFSLLMSLNRPEPASLSSVAAVLAMDRTTLTANLKPLERQGYLTITADPQDRRARRLTLTPAGHRVLLAALPLWRESHDALEALLAGNAERLRRDLMVLTA